MMNLVFLNQGKPVTDSLTVAEVFGKSHDNVVRDIRVQLAKLAQAGETEWGVLNFEETEYQHDRNKQWYTKFNLTEEAFAIVAMSYVTPSAMKMKIRFLEEFKRMKQQLLSQHHNIPQTLHEALYLAANLEGQRAKLAEEKLLLEQKTIEQQEKLKEQEAPVAIYNLALSARNTMTMQEVAKSLNTGRTRLFRILREEGIIMKNSTMPYQRYLDAGYFKVTERPRASGDTIINDPATRVYPKGFDFIARLMQKRAETNGQST